MKTLNMVFAQHMDSGHLGDDQLTSGHHVLPAYSASEVEMRSIVMRRTGAPEVLELEERAMPVLAAGEVRLRSLASAINHSDLEIRAGNWNIRREPRFPYVPGLEVVGEVVEVATDVEQLALGDRVWTTMQGLGGVRAERDGGYAEYVVVSASVLARLPPETNPIAFAALGLAALTALEGLRKLGSLHGKTLIVSGARGGVGEVATEIARARGAHVVALHRDSRTPPPRCADAVFDTVAGQLFGPLMGALRPRGRYCLVGAVAGGDVQLDAWSLLDGRTLTGYSSEDLDGPALRVATEELLGMSLALPEPAVFPLAEAARAHERLENRSLRGRVVLSG